MIAQAGLQCVFREAIPLALWGEVRSRNFTIGRIDLQHLDLSLTAALAAEAVACNVQPLCTVNKAAQLSVTPAGALHEFGNEPNLEHFLRENFEGSFTTYVDEMMKAVRVAVDKKLPLYVGAISNLNDDGLKFLRRLPWRFIPKEVGVSVHRYPEGGGTPQDGHDGMTRTDEVEELLSIVGMGRKMAVTEVGYHTGPGGWTEVEAADNLAWERRFFGEQGFELVCMFQINDGDPKRYDRKTMHEAYYGARRQDGTWKDQIVDAFTRSDQ